MPFSLKNSRVFRWLIRLLKYSSILLLTVILLVSIVLVFLPTAVSTDWSHRLIQTQISKALARDVRIGSLNWSWQDGIILNNISIPDLPEFSQNPLVSLEHAGVKLSIPRLLHRELNLELIVSNLDVRIIKDSSGTLNIQTLGGKKPLPEKPPAPAPKKEIAEKKPVEKKEKKPMVLPLDVSADIQFIGINLLYDDRAKAQKYRVKDLEIKLGAPSVKTSPVTLAIGLDVQVNDHPIPRSFLNASLENLFDAEGALNIDGIVAGLDAELPGIVATVNADMTASALESDIQVDLASLVTVARPLIPNFPSPTDINGNIALTVHTDANPQKPVAFNVLLTGSGLQASGKVLDGKSIGPGDLSFSLAGILDLTNERLNLDSADINILENSRIHAFGQIDHIKDENKDIRFAVSPLYLDLTEITSFIQPFIPASIKFNNQGKSSAIALNKLQIEGKLPKGQADVELDDLAVMLPDIVLKDANDGKPILQISGADLNLAGVAAKLSDLFPESAALNLSFSVDELKSGKIPNEISVSGIRLDHLSANAANIQKTDQSKLKVECQSSVDNLLTVKQIKIPDLLQIQNLEQSLNVLANLRPDGSVKASLDHLVIVGEKISVLKKDVGPVETGLKIRLSLDELLVKNLAPFNADIQKFIARLNIDDAVSMAIHASAVDTANTSFKTDIKIDSDLNKLIKKIPPKLLAGISGAGNLNITVHAAGRRPAAKEIDALKNKQLKDNLGFIDQAGLAVRLDNGRLEIPQKDKENIIIGSITAGPLLAYELSGATGRGDLNASLKAGSFKGLPAVNPEAPINVEFALSGSHDFVHSLELHQSFSVLPANIKESVDVRVDGLDRILSRSPMPKPLLWISDIGAEAAVNVNIPDCGTLKKMGLPGLSKIDLSGHVDTGVALHLVPDQSIDGGLSLAVNDMNVSISEKFSAEKIRANIDFSKSYQIQSANRPVPASESSGLSANVLRLSSGPAAFAENNNIFDHIRLVHERMNPDPSISLQKADISAGPFPIAIGESLMMLNLKNGLPRLDYFQFNLLGGTINGSIALTGQKEKFYVNTALTFSGINTSQFFPRAFSKDDYREADISGSLYADFPITHQLQTLLENAAITIEFTSIGSRALERMLYALDPYENNEAIVSQRRLLKAGSPKQIRLDIKDGFLSLRGEVAVKGISISLPAIRRLNIAQIPGMERFQDRLSGLSPLILILQKVSAGNIVINKQTNAISFE